MNPLFKLLGIQNTFLKFNEKVGELGWAMGCAWLIDSLNIKYRFEGGTIPPKGAVLIYANHPTGLDPYLISAVSGRNDSYFWGDLYQLKKGNNIAKHIIPIAPKPFWTIIRRPLSNWPGYIYMRLTTPSLSKSETKKVNEESIEKTVDFLRHGKQIVIFPSGGEFEFLPRKSGLVRVITECKKRNIKISIYGIKIKKFGELSLFSHFIFNTKIDAILEQV